MNTKVTRIISGVFGGLAAALAFYFVYITIRFSYGGFYSRLWFALNEWAWPGYLLRLISSHGAFLTISSLQRNLVYLVIAVQFAVPILAVMLAKHLGRHGFLWLLITIFFPFAIFLLIIPSRLGDLRITNQVKGNNACLSLTLAVVLEIVMIVLATNMGRIIWQRASAGLPGSLNYGILFILLGLAAMFLVGMVDEDFHPGPRKTYTNLDFDQGVGAFGMLFSLYGLVVVVKTLIFFFVVTFS